MMTKTVQITLVARCDVGLCDTTGTGPIYVRRTGSDAELMLAELEGSGWILMDEGLDACPSCKRAMLDQRAQPMEDADGA